MGDKGREGSKISKKWVTSFIDGPFFQLALFASITCILGFRVYIKFSNTLLIRDYFLLYSASLIIGWTNALFWEMLPMPWFHSMDKE